jgi:hypothetical protein
MVLTNTEFCVFSRQFAAKKICKALSRTGISLGCTHPVQAQFLCQVTGDLPSSPNFPQGGHFGLAALDGIRAAGMELMLPVPLPF